MTVVSRGLVLFIADVTVRATVLLVCTAIIAILSRRASASFRHLIWTLGLGSALCLPLLTPALPGWRIPLKPLAVPPAALAAHPGGTLATFPPPAPYARAGSRSADPILGSRTLQRPVASAFPISTVHTATPSPVSSFPWPMWVLLLWATGAILVLAQLAQGLVSVRRIERESVSVTGGWCADLVAAARAAMGVTRAITVRQMSSADGVTVPLTYGARRPVIVLPIEADGWPAERLRAALLHELAHIRRRDWLLQVGTHLVHAVYWFHPLVWLAAKQARAEGEAACDDLVLATGMPAGEYARQLLDVACNAQSSFRFEPNPVNGAVAMAQTPRVEGRLRRILAAGCRRGEVTRRLRGMSWGIGLCVLVVGAMVRPVSRAAGKRMAPTHAAGARSNGPVVGRVVTPEGEPASHISVSWIERGEDGISRRRFVAETDGQGQFRFAEAPPNPSENRSVTLLAQALKWGVGLRSLPSPLPADAVLTLTLQPPTTLRVSFVDEAGKPVPNVHARVRTLFDRQHSFLEIPADMHGPWEQQADARGACVFPGLPQGAQARFTIEEEAYAEPAYDEAISLANVSAQQADPIRLIRSGSVQGRVTFPDGKPAAGVRVGAQGVIPPGSWEQAVTDADGAYHIAHLRPDIYNIAVWLAGELEQTRTARALEKAVVRPGSALQHDFVLIAGAQITGRVTDASTGEPIPDVQVGIYGPAHPQSGAAVQSAQTGPDGRFRLRVPAGPQYV